ncbi:MAG TPA: hypothetical protein VMT03_11710 [Polyangia bacterium]|nr:hypothetical protein [Polyangia bacterium]
MDLPRTDPDRTRFSYLRLRRLKEAINDPRVLDALAREMDIQAAAGQQLKAIEGRIEELRSAPGSFWHGVDAPEILAASILKSRPQAPDLIDEIFRAVPLLQDLSKPLSEWLHLAGLTPQGGGVPRTGRANLIGVRGGRFLASPRVVGIEAINDSAELEVTLGDKSIDNTHAAFVACTPAVAASFLWFNATRLNRWDGDALRRGLEPSGRGFLIVEGDAISGVIRPRERKPEKALLQQLTVDLQAGRKA